MTEFAFLVSGFSVTIAVVGYLIRRAVTVHDKNEIRTQEMIMRNAQMIGSADEKIGAMAVQQAAVMADILTEAKLTNHRITVLEATEIATRRRRPSADDE